MSKRKFTIDEVRKMFFDNKYTLLTDEYINCYQKLEYECPNGHIHFVNLHNWRSNDRRCPYCSGYFRKDINFVRREFKKNDYILISDVYINAHKKLKYICPNGHHNKINWNNWKNGRRCPTCNNITRSGKNNHNWKGGITTKEEKERIYFKTKISPIVLERDNYICQKCNKYGGSLNAHHIKPWAFFIDERFNVNNCITLCVDCHNWVHSKNNIDKDFLYIENKEE